jgi:protein TonB
MLTRPETMRTLLILITLTTSVSTTLGQFNKHQRNMEFSTDSIIPNTSGPVHFPAEFVGGMSKFYKFIGKKLRYPKDAKRQKMEGRVYVEFFIDKDGSIPPDSVRVVRGFFESCDKEAVRIIRASPRWIPGRVVDTGEPVAQRMVLPIMFKR